MAKGHAGPGQPSRAAAWVLALGLALIASQAAAQAPPGDAEAPVPEAPGQAPSQAPPQTPAEAPAPEAPAAPAEDAAAAPAENPPPPAPVAPAPAQEDAAAEHDAAAPAEPTAPAPPAPAPPTPAAPAPAPPDAVTAAPEPGWDEEDASDAAGWGEDASDAAGWGEDANDEAGWGEGDDAAGFGSAAATGDGSAEEAAPEPGRLEGSGNLRHRVALWSERMDEQPFAQARQSVDLALRYKKPLRIGDSRLLLRMVGDGHVEYDLAYRHARERFDDPTLDAYEFQLIGRESFVALSWDALELTFGRQIVAWGQGEMLSPLDVTNPRDLREPGMAELVDIRMAVLASRAGLFFGNHRLELMVVHESFFGLRPAPLSDYSPLRQLLLDDPQVAAVLAGKTLRYQDVPDRFVEGAGQLYARWAYAGPGVDLALYAASTLDKQGVFELLGPSELLASELSLRLWHPRYTLFGHAGAYPTGDFVLRWELLVELDRPLNVRDPEAAAAAIEMVRRHQLGGMLGATYYGLDDATLSFEYAQSYVVDNPDRDAGEPDLLASAEEPSFGLRATHTFMHERLTASLAGMWIGLDRYLGSFARAELSYLLQDALTIGIGYALYAPSTDNFGPFYGLTRHDRVFATIRWDFLLD